FGGNGGNGFVFSGGDLSDLRPVNIDSNGSVRGGNGGAAFGGDGDDGGDGGDGGRGGDVRAQTVDGGHGGDVPVNITVEGPPESISQAQALQFLATGGAGGDAFGGSGGRGGDGGNGGDANGGDAVGGNGGDGLVVSAGHDISNSTNKQRLEQRFVN